MELKDLGPLVALLAPLFLSLASVVIAARVLQVQVNNSSKSIPTPNIQEEFSKAWQQARIQDAVTLNIMLEKLNNIEVDLRWLVSHR